MIDREHRRSGRPQRRRWLGGGLRGVGLWRGRLLGGSHRAGAIGIASRHLGLYGVADRSCAGFDPLHPKRDVLERAAGIESRRGPSVG
jgi:hypothetical protein